MLSAVIAPVLVALIDGRCAHLLRIVLRQTVVGEAFDFIAFVAIALGRFLHGFRLLKSLFLQQAVPLDQPVQYRAPVLGLCELPLERPVLLALVKVAVKGNDHHPAARKQRHIRHGREVVGIDIELELRLVVEAVLAQEPRVDGIVARHGLYLRGIEHQALARLGDIDEAYTRQPRDILGGRCTVGVYFDTQRFGAGGAAVFSQHLEHALAQRSLTVARRRAVHNKHTLELRISRKTVAQRLLQEPRFLHVLGYLPDKSLKPFAARFGVVSYV